MNNNDSPTYGIHDRTVGSSTSKMSEVSYYEKNNPPSLVDDIDKGSKSSDHLENQYDGTQNVETTGSDNVGDGDAVKNQDGKLTLRSIEKRSGDIAGDRTMNCKQPIEKRLFNSSICF